MDYLTLGKTPIAPEAPAGSNIKYDKVFEELQSEIDKLSIPSLKGGFSWEKVEKLASSILKDKSKDLLVTSYLGVALVNLDGLNGLHVASSIYHDVLHSYWSNLFPEATRIKGRIAAIEWWVDKTVQVLKEKSFSLPKDKSIKQIEETLGRINDFLSSNEETNQVSVEAIIVNLKKAAEKCAEKEQEAGIKSSESYVAEKDAKQNLISCFKFIQQTAKAIRKDELDNPQPYRWSRFACWEPIKTLPLAKDGKTKISPPPAINVLNQLKGAGDWQNLLDVVEKKLYDSAHIFLLDLNRFAAEALSRLGENYRNAYDAVCLETRYFVNRLPGVENLLFSDGTPFADEETKEWLKHLNVRQLPEGKGEAHFQAATNTADPLLDEIARTKELVKKNDDFLGAVEIFQNKMHGCISRRETFLWRLGLVDIVLNKDISVSLINSLLEEVLNDVEEYQTEKWEPELALKGLKTVYKIFKTQTTQEYKTKTADILKKIAKFNPAEALKL